MSKDAAPPSGVCDWRRELTRIFFRRHASQARVTPIRRRLGTNGAVLPDEVEPCELAASIRT
jgi:hypothetical protein